MYSMYTTYFVTQETRLLILKITNKLLTLIIAFVKQNNYDNLNILPLLLIAHDNRNNDYY